MGVTLGIDLGTTNSVTAFRLGDNSFIVKADDNRAPERTLTRSVVAIEKEKFIVGEQAYNAIRNSSINTVVSVKRLMGRSFNDPVVVKQQENCDYSIVSPSLGTDNAVAISAASRELTPEQISAEILKKVVSNAVIYGRTLDLNIDNSRTVVTVPAYFNDKQRAATKEAAQLAGLNGTELLPEPTAAAISYGFSPNSNDVKNILVYDFGGGTFDCCIITATGTDFIESSKEGDLWLGGDDIDKLLIEHVLKMVEEQEQLANIYQLIDAMPLSERVRLRSSLRIAAERAKVDLSTMQETLINADGLIDEAGFMISIGVNLNRNTFENIITPFVKRTIYIAERTLESSGFQKQDIDVVLMVGGSSLIPFVQAQVSKAFAGTDVVVHPRPMLAVAEGAAIHAAGLVQKVGSVSRDYDIALVDGDHRLIGKGSPLPVTVSHTFKTIAKGQEMVHFKFLSPDESREGRKEAIGEMWLSLKQGYPKGTEVQVICELDDKENALTITGFVKMDPSQKVTCVISRGGSDESILSEAERIIAKVNESKALTDHGALKVASEINELVRKVVVNMGSRGGIDPIIYYDARDSLRKIEARMSEINLQLCSHKNFFHFVEKCCLFLLTDMQRGQFNQLLPQIEKLSELDSDDSNNLNNKCNAFMEEIDAFAYLLFMVIQAANIESRRDAANGDRLYIKTDEILSALENGDRDHALFLYNSITGQVHDIMAAENVEIGQIATGISV
jgi:molecular chaperone DnaK